MKLWIDDTRIKPDDYDLWAKTAEEAIEALLRGGITFISFDHDLGLLEENGYSVAAWIEKKVYSDIEFVLPEWTIHSSNVPGSLNIDAAMRGAACIRGRQAEEIRKQRDDARKRLADAEMEIENLRYELMGEDL